jgi:hypothetical protein
MLTKTNIDGGHAFDWGQSSPDYAVYRPGYPVSFYTVLQALEIGTGVLARTFAPQGARRASAFGIHGLGMRAEDACPLVRFKVQKVIREHDRIATVHRREAER